MFKLFILCITISNIVNAKITSVNVGELVSSDKINIIIDEINKAYDIGEMRPSLLPETIFQSRNGNCWVLMKGQDISSSVYAQLTGKTNLPNAEGKFLRNVGGNAPALGETQTHELYTHTHIQNQHNHGQDSHNHIGGSARAVGYAYSEQSPWGTWQPGAGSVSIEGGGNYNRGFAYTSPSTPFIHNQVAVNQNYGGVETRPDNFSVNTFIKINHCN